MCVLPEKPSGPLNQQHQTTTSQSPRGDPKNQRNIEEPSLGCIAIAFIEDEDDSRPGRVGVDTFAPGHGKDLVGRAWGDLIWDSKDGQTGVGSCTSGLLMLAA